MEYLPKRKAAVGRLICSYMQVQSQDEAREVAVSIEGSEIAPNRAANDAGNQLKPYNFE